jgi:hypothetical protein
LEIKFEVMRGLHPKPKVYLWKYRFLPLQLRFPLVRRRRTAL